MHTRNRIKAEYTVENENRTNMEVVSDEEEEIVYATPEEQMEEATARLETLVAALGLSPRVLNGWKCKFHPLSHTCTDF